MTKWNRILAVVVVVVVAGGIAWLTLRAREPVYQGKKLTAWLEQDLANPSIDIVEPPKSGHQPLSYEADAARHAQVGAEAETAIRHIGTNALPYLVKMVAVKDSPIKQKLVNLLSRQSVVKIHYRLAWEYHMMAESGFEALGPEATPAVPSLIKLLYYHSTNGDESIQLDASECLAYIGEPAVPYLLPLLTNSGPRVRFYAGSAAVGIASRLAQGIRSNANEANRCRMIEVLSEIIVKKDSELAEVLTNALKDKSFLVRSAATNALKRIKAEAARKAGVK